MTLFMLEVRWCSSKDFVKNLKNNVWLFLGDYYYFGNGQCVSKLAQWNPVGISSNISGSLTQSNWTTYGSGFGDSTSRVSACKL